MDREAIHTLAAVAIAVVAVGLVAMVPSATGYTGHIHDAEAERLTGRARVEAMYGSDVASGAAFEISTCDLELRSAKDLTPQQFEAEYGAGTISSWYGLKFIFLFLLCCRLRAHGAADRRSWRFCRTTRVSRVVGITSSDPPFAQV